MRTFLKEGDLLIRLSAWSLIIAVALFAFVPSLGQLSASQLLSLATPLLYLGLSIGVTVWVARTLEPAWRPFLRRQFNDDDVLAPAIASTLSTMYILMGCGLAALLLPHAGESSQDHARYLELLEAAQSGGMAFVPLPSGDGAFELLASGLGQVLLVLGILSLWITRYCMRQQVRVLFDGDLSLPDLPPLPVREPVQAPPPETKRGGQPLAW